MRRRDLIMGIANMSGYMAARRARAASLSGFDDHQRAKAAKALGIGLPVNYSLLPTK